MCILCTQFSVETWERAYEYHMRNTIDKWIGCEYYDDGGHVKFKGRNIYQIYATLMRQRPCPEQGQVSDRPKG